MSSEHQPVSTRDGPPGKRRPAQARRLAARAAWPALTILAIALVAWPLVTHLGQPSRRTLVVAAVPYWNLQHATSAVLANRQDVNEVSPWIYGLTSSGAIVPQYPSSEAAAVGSDLARLRAAHMRIVPSIANMTAGAWDYPAIARTLHNPMQRRQHVDAIVALVQRQHYAGIDIDYEELHPGDRQVFTEFVRELSAALHSHGKVLSVAVFAQTARPAGNDPNSAQDYAALGKAADQVRVMGYDYHWANSGPGPTAPIDWVRSVLRYATSQMPASKVVLGIPLFGFDWPDGNFPAATVSWLQALRLSRQHDVAASYSAANQTPYFSYGGAGRTHVVWFENAESSRAKFEAAKGNRVAGVFLWMYGYEDPATWASLHAVLPTTGPGASSTSTSVP